MNLRTKLRHNILNMPGWHTKRHIVVIESDDWGALRMPSKDVYEYLLGKGFRVDDNPYEKYDSLATEEDLSALFEALSSFKDVKGNSPVITANCAVANPDFDKIRASNFRNYFYEPFTTTLSHYSGCHKSFDLWMEGLKNNIFKPQFHAREHLNVARWLSLLQAGDEDVLLAFDKGMMGISPRINYEIGDVCQVAYDDSEYSIQPLEDVISEGLDIFERIFGYKSFTSIAPCYTWNPRLEKKLYEKGVIGIQGIVYQQVPGQKSILHWNGSKNSLGQVYTVRNCFFEPSIDPSFNYFDDCLYRIKCAFRWGKPAIISSHRINYIGAVHKDNRDRSLVLLKKLLRSIIDMYPDVEFMSSDMLVNEIIKG